MRRKITYIIILFAVLLLSSCQKEVTREYSSRIVEDGCDVDTLALGKSSNVVYAECVETITGENGEYVDYIFRINDQLKGNIEEELITVRYDIFVAENEGRNDPSMQYQTLTVGHSYVMMLVKYVSVYHDQIVYQEKGEQFVTPEQNIRTTGSMYWKTMQKIWNCGGTIHFTRNIMEQNTFIRIICRIS